MVHDYTDHGFEHSQRVGGFACKLLDAAEGPAISSEEAYVLLAGVYLHDVGMQCDPLRFPQIRDRAEMMGARYNVNFDGQTSGGAKHRSAEFHSF